MKRVILYSVSVLSAFMIFIGVTDNVKALTNEEVKNEIQSYATELDSMVSSVETQIGNFENWSVKYAGTLKKIMTKEISSNLASAITNENYAGALDIIENGLRNAGEVNAANELSNLKPEVLNLIDKSLDYEIRLTNFLNSNKDTVLVADMLPLIDSARATYNKLRAPIKSILDIYYNAYYTDAKNKFNQYKTLTVTELDALFEQAKDELYIYEDYINTLNNKMNSWYQLFKDLGLDGMGFEDLIYEDVKPYVDKAENLFIDVYNQFVELQWTELRKEGEFIVNDALKTIQERNQILLDKIDYYTSLKQKAISNFTTLKSKITINKILNKVNQLETKALGECDKAIEYVRSLLLVEDFDIILRDGVTNEQVMIDRNVHYLITRNEYDLDTFMAFLKVKNENSGVLKAINVYDEVRIGTKSVVGVYQGNDEKIRYNVILKGDTRANGIIDVSDVTYTIKHILKTETFDEIETVAGDMNDDNLLDISDVTATIKKALS